MHILLNPQSFLKALFVSAGTNEILAAIEAEVIIIMNVFFLSSVGQYTY